uniref:Reverse transcriptase domain-containing protein n=1 Tax=Tanacetum cinerariifolium TaxID=118510 RepID=A0A6L2MG70_TANCI|nr:reverse transcriptase domain-containing protein [Tanacetum cinerariifolium]
MSAMANTTPLVTTVTKPATNPRDMDATPRVNIQEFCEEYYEDILPIIMDKVRHDRRKDVHTRLDFGEGPRERTREDSHHSSARARTTKPERLKVQDRLRYDPVGQIPRTVLEVKAIPTGWTLQMKIVQRIRNASVVLENHMKRRKDNESSLSSVSKSDSSEGREGRGSNRFNPLTRTPKEILVAEAGKFQPPPPMVTPVEKRSSNKFCYFHNDKGHSTDECMQLKKQIEELVRAGKLKEIKHGRDQSKTGKKETSAKDKPTEIYMIQSSGTEGSLVIEAEMGGHMIHRMYVDGGDVDHSTRTWMNFMIVRSLSPYNGIIGRPEIREIQAVPSTAHEMLKFPVEGGIVTIRSTILIPTEFTLVITSSTVSKEERTCPDNFKVALHPDFPDKEVAIEGTLSKKGRTELCLILEKNLDIFAWKTSDMTRVPRSIAEHQREGYSPVRDHERGLLPQLAVQSSHGKETRRQLADIQLAEPDEEKTAFHTGEGVYCYTKMPFGLKNADATYQRLMDKAFNNKIGRNIEVYVDDLVVKSYIEAEMIRDSDETFRTLRKINMKLNLKKCTFGVAEGVFLGYVVIPNGINPCPNKTAAILQLASPQTSKEVQSLNGKLASLNRFLSKSAEKSLPLFKTLKKRIKKSDFHWTTESEQAFKQLKQHLSELPLLVAPKPKEELIIYLSATYGADC